MHPNQVFRQTAQDRSLAFASERGFGILAINGAERPALAHVPFILLDGGAAVGLHLVRSNPIARQLKDPVAATLAVSGPDGYVSPDWYEAGDQVPTWNYVAVHIHGALELRPQDEMRDLLNRQSAAFEKRIPGKTPWTLSKLTPATERRMMRMIVPCRLSVRDVQSTWKLNQNKPDDARLAAAEKVAAASLGYETDALGAFMRTPPEASGNDG